MTKDYVSLHNHTTYSLMDSLIRPGELFSRAKELGQSAIAVTDHFSLAGAWDSFKASKKHGVKLIIGCEFNFVENLNDSNSPIYHVILLAKNHIGYKNLLLASKLANDNFIVAFNKVVPRIDWSILEKCSDGIICTTACGGGILGRLINTRKIDEAKKRTERLKEIYGDSLALEIQPHAMVRNASPYNDYEDQRLVNNTLINFGDLYNIKVIATTDAHYLNKDDWETHDTLLAIGSGMPVRAVARLKYPSHEFYMKSRDEVVNFFRRYYNDRAEEFCDNTLYFADMCEKPEWIDPKYSNPSGKELPEFPVKDQKDYLEFKNWLQTTSVEKTLPEDAAYLRYWCEKEFIKKVPRGRESEYRDRLNEELDVIETKGFSSYMLIVADYIDWARENNISVGPGRGSIGGSLIGYLTSIHKADPIINKTIFARFLNKEKNNYPDIDTDFAPSGRELVQKYVIQKYGLENVAHVSNINTMTPKVYARDIARAFEFGGDRKLAVEIGTNIADSIPEDIGSVLEAFDDAPLFAEYANSDKYGQLKKHSTLDGIKKNFSTHAGGIIITKRPLVEFIPTRRDKENNFTIEYDKDQADENGLVKMDILGSETLDIIDNTYNLIISNNKTPPPKPFDYFQYDKSTYDLISSGNTLCVFQFGTSAGTIDLCKKIKPKSIEDLAIINALARPAARDIRSKFIETKDGKLEIKLLHPTLERAFKSTYGFGIFEESLMYLAQDVAGWSLHEADALRKLTKEKGKNPKKAAKLKQDFIDGAINKGIGRELGTQIWEEVVENFGDYGFNAAHAVLYSCQSFHTAYLKAHFPLEFLVANLMSEVNSNAKVSKNNIINIKNEIRELGVKIIPPDINSSSKTYKIADDNTLYTGLNSLKFMGKDSIPEILQHRPFTSFEDFLRKVNGRNVRVTSVQALASAGGLDNFGLSRKQMYLYASDYKKKLQVWNKKTQEGFKYPWPDNIGEWTAAEKYAMETYYLGEGFSCGMRDAYPGFFDNWAINFSKLADKFPESSAGEKRLISKEYGVIEGVIRSVREMTVKKETSKIFGKIMLKADIEDPYGNVLSITIFPGGVDLLNERLRILSGDKIKFEPGIAVHCAASVNWYAEKISLIFEDLKKVAPIPPLPKDLESRKVVMKLTKEKTIKKKTSKLDPETFLEQIEDELVEEGFFNLKAE